MSRLHVVIGILLLACLVGLGYQGSRMVCHAEQAEAAKKAAVVKKAAEDAAKKVEAEAQAKKAAEDAAKKVEAEAQAKKAAEAEAKAKAEAKAETEVQAKRAEEAARRAEDAAKKAAETRPQTIVVEVKGIPAPPPPPPVAPQPQAIAPAPAPIPAPRVEQPAPEAPTAEQDFFEGFEEYYLKMEGSPKKRTIKFEGKQRNGGTTNVPPAVLQRALQAGTRDSE